MKGTRMGDIIDSEPCRLLPTMRLARMHETMNRHLLAAELHQAIYNKTGNQKALLRMEALAESAASVGRHSVAEAIYILLCRSTGHQKYLAKAIAAGYGSQECFRAS